MKTKMVVAAIGAVLLAGTPVLVVDATPEQKCVALEQQFDSAIKVKSHLDESDGARELRDEGSNLCEAGNHAEGIAKLEQAMKTIGVKAL